MPMLGLLSKVGLGAAGGLAQGIASAVPTAQSKHNKKRLDELQAREESGNLGLDPAEEAAMQSKLQAPVRRAATEGMNQYAALSAATGEGNGAYQQQLRESAGQRTAASAQDAALAVRQADVAGAERQRNEIEQRLAARAQKRTDILDGVFGSLAGVAEPLGEHVEGQAISKLGTTIPARTGAPPDPRVTAERAMAEAGMADAKRAALNSTVKADPAMVAEYIARGVDPTDAYWLAIEAQKNPGSSLDTGISAGVRAGVRAAQG